MTLLRWIAWVKPFSLLKALQAVLLQPSDSYQQNDFNQHIQYVNDGPRDRSKVWHSSV